MKTNLYLDVDGVMLRRTPQGFQVADHALLFLRFATDHFNAYWLTARSHEGNTAEVERAFRHAMPNPTASKQDRNALTKIVSAIPAAAWREMKAGAFSAEEDFYWIDDNPDQASQSWLEQQNLSSRIVVASTDQHPDDLSRVQGVLQEIGSSFQKPEFVQLPSPRTKNQMKENIVAVLARTGIAVERNSDRVTGEKVDD
jgi:hypothetical protein